MKNIRLATLAKIIIPLFIICAVAIIKMFIFYQEAVLEERDFLKDTIASFGVTLAPHIVHGLETVEARAVMFYTILTTTIGVFVVIALSALFIVTYKLAPVRRLIGFAGALSKKTPEEAAGFISKDELGGLTKELADVMRLNDKNLEVLKDALEKANAASKAKGDFLSNMSHEIRTPLNAIIGMTNLARTSNSEERKDYALEKIADASGHLLGIINDILDMSKIEADKLELHSEIFLFDGMLQKVLNMVNFKIAEKKQKLVVNIDDQIPKVIKTDDQRLSQALMNLLTNAVKFTPEEGSITLNVKLLERADKACKFQVDVIDTGVGISAEQQEGLFDAFFQAESSTTRKYGGTGLGLTIVKSIVTLLNGEISVSSELGKGSTFTFTFLAEEVDEATESEFFTPGKAKLKEMRMLIADDDEDIREYFLSIAKQFNIECDVAASGEETIEFLKKGVKYDICFVDWHMPGGMDGIELTQHIRNTNDDNSVVVMISSVEWQNISGQAKEAGIDKFLPKPILPSSFIECIKQYFDVDLDDDRRGKNDEKEIRFWGYRILLVEDVDINREIVLSLLEPTDLEIDCAVNGADAVRIFQNSPENYNLILMDLQMPEMDGFEATRKIRALDNINAKSIPIVAMTANVFKDDVDKCLEAGMNEHIGKPLDFSKLMHILKKYLYLQRPINDRRKYVKERLRGKGL